MMSAQLSQMLGSVMNSKTFLLLPEDQVQLIIKEAQSAKTFDQLSKNTQDTINNALKDNETISKNDAYKFAINSISQ